MKVVYATRTGNVEMFVNKLGLSDVMQIKDGTEKVNEEFVLVTYTDGYGELPAEVEEFLSNNAHNLRGVAASGDYGYGDAFAMAADVISEMYNVPILAKFEFDGTDEDVQKFLAELAKLG
ncbi:MAG: class Ib ribonucleoside-diphosphate reductase assembly flavoprotein NrdI [Acholeplasmataceae bacterium]|nr:class Ib ribonucleoside-diphosphate reductase assembly flavoprotein NrdI [Acholeplasmataceae bacterium]HPT89597.1 class Ib ribonucleoside-diphosphate reductase assembly flavoprotein NrdI [Bacilli bacterium]HQA19351.1 class Ib ribonucleoside-diphosphate reductase assembly flavoprotein NrdI [Bacilli bacterium]HQD91997.1 class Ib ribonucleoside-diphosphate reductase assembly flavoprotein NrdI [Bacilli bacterium]